jgi:hypothetical protein
MRQRRLSPPLSGHLLREVLSVQVLVALSCLVPPALLLSLQVEDRWALGY